MASTGFKFAGTGASVDTGDNPWVSPLNITENDDTNSNSDEFGEESVSDKLRATNFDFSSIPAGAGIDGIEVRYRRFNNGDSQEVVTTTLRLVLAGVDQGTAKTPSGNWEATKTANTQGGASDLWGDSPTRADVQTSTWGVDISVLWDGALPLGNGCKVDSVEMNVHYNVPSSGGSLLPLLGVG